MNTCLLSIVIATSYCLNAPSSAQESDPGSPNLVAMSDQEDAVARYQQHLVFLAHPSLEGRLPGEPGCEIAEEMIETTFRQLGLRSPESLPDFRQSFQFSQGGRFGDRSKAKIVTGQNVCAVLPGAGPLSEQWIILGAHHDHIGRGSFGSRTMAGEIHEGADDNASGTSAVLLAAGLLAELFIDEETPRRSILFMTFSGEESGLNGSRHYVENPVVPLSSTVAMINLDMIGRLVDGEVQLTGIGSGTTFDEMIEGIDVDSTLKIQRGDTLSSRSDHASFYDKGVPVLFLTETVFPDEYHTPDDESSRIDFESGANAAILAAEIVRRLAVATRAPEFMEIEGADNSNDGPSFTDIKIRFGIKPGNYGDLEPGIVVSGVSEGTSAEDGGVLPGDIMIRWNDVVIDDVRAWMGMMAEHEPGDIVHVTVIRGQTELILPIMLKPK
jgi:hypothetical protein